MVMSFGNSDSSNILEKSGMYGKSNQTMQNFMTLGVSSSLIQGKEQIWDPIAKLFKKPSMPEVEEATTYDSDSSATAAATAEAERLRKRKGMKSTIIDKGSSGSLGDSDLQKATAMG
jgi:hypothetical protein